MNHLLKLVSVLSLALAANAATAATVSIAGTMNLSSSNDPWGMFTAIESSLVLQQPVLLQSGDQVAFDFTFANNKAIRFSQVPDHDTWGLGVSFTRLSGQRITPTDDGVPTALSNESVTLTGVRRLWPNAGDANTHAMPIAVPVPGLSGVQPEPLDLVGTKTGESFNIDPGQSLEFTGFKGTFNIDELGGPAAFAEMANFYLGGLTRELVIVDASAPGQSVPEPATLMLSGIGLAGLAGVLRRRRKQQPQS